MKDLPDKPKYGVMIFYYNSLHPGITILTGQVSVPKMVGEVERIERLRITPKLG
jgi:hypothetical protein